MIAKSGGCGNRGNKDASPLPIYMDGSQPGLFTSRTRPTHHQGLQRNFISPAKNVKLNNIYLNIWIIVMFWIKMRSPGQLGKTE